MNRLKDLINDFAELFFPEICLSCENRLISQEKYMCISCWHDLPLTRFHLNPENNKVAQLFWGRLKTEYAAAWFSYKKGSHYQQLIHNIKYKGLKELGFEAGSRYGFELAESPEFNSADIVIPVPLHIKKQKKRGFNQSEWIANGIASGLKKPVIPDNLYRQIHTNTQTRKNRFERWQNVEGIFDVRNPAEFEGKHLLLVDDVITTGSTLEACANPLLKIPDVRVSIVTLAYADV
jgi:ComF family protein